MKKHWIVIRCQFCKGMIFAVANLPETLNGKTLKTLGRLVMENHTVEHVDFLSVGLQETCKCEREAA